MPAQVYGVPNATGTVRRRRRVLRGPRLARAHDGYPADGECVLAGIAGRDTMGSALAGTAGHAGPR
ncbi:MAG TPA: hypothetical protein VIM11_11685, partial [Tepidisphaeraceae bacterium]